MFARDYRVARLDQSSHQLSFVAEECFSFGFAVLVCHYDFKTYTKHPSPTACSREDSAEHISPNKCPISSALNHSLDKSVSVPTPYTLNHPVHVPTKHMHGSAPQHFPELPGCRMLKAHYTQALPRGLTPYLSSVSLSLPL